MHRNASTLTACCSVMALVAVLAYQAGARPNGFAGATVATVNLSRALDGLLQRGDAEAGLKAKTEKIILDQQAKEKEIELKREEYEQATDDEVRFKAEEDLALLTLRYQAWQQFVRDQLDVERALLLQDLYRSITNAVEDLAETQAFDLIVVDDSQMTIDWNPDAKISREMQTLTQIRGRRVLFRNDGIDVTDDLVARMNNAYRAGQK